MFTRADYEVAESWDELNHFCPVTESSKGLAHALAVHERRLASAEDVLLNKISLARCSAAERQSMTQTDVGKLRKKARAWETLIRKLDGQSKKPILRSALGVTVGVRLWIWFLEATKLGSFLFASLCNKVYSCD